MPDAANHNRRSFLGVMIAGGMATAGTTFMDKGNATAAQIRKSSLGLASVKQAPTGILTIGYYEAGPSDGPPVLLLHGFPYSVDSYVEVAPILAERGCRVFVPYLRGHGTTRFLDGGTPRSVQQGAIGVDVFRIMVSFGLTLALLACYECCFFAFFFFSSLFP